MTFVKAHTREVGIVDKDTPAKEIVEQMRKYGSNDVIVVVRDGNKVKPVGLVNVRNVLFKGKIGEVEVTAGDLMTEVALVFQEKDELLNCIKQMLQAGEMSNLVLTQRGEIVGVLTAEDLFFPLGEKVLRLKDDHTRVSRPNPVTVETAMSS